MQPSFPCFFFTKATDSPASASHAPKPLGDRDRDCRVPAFADLDEPVAGRGQGEPILAVARVLGRRVRGAAH